jgi:uncharacterized protein
MMNRREFINTAGISAAALLCGGKAHAGESNPARSFEHGQPLQQFRYDQIKFLGGIHQAQFEQTHSVLMGLDEDALLRPYRRRVGLAAPGCDLAGWYGSDAFGAETFGQWISALSRSFAITNDQEICTKVERLVRAFSEAVEPTGKLFGDIKLTHGPAYHYDKLVCGLMDAHEYCHQPIALDVLKRTTEAVLNHLPGKAIDGAPGSDGAHETYTIPENQFIVWQRGGSDSHLEMARAYLYHSFFDPLARGENVLAGRHAYSHVNALCSAAKAYLVLGDEDYLRAAKNGLSFVEAQSYATGGWGPGESFIPTVGNAGSGFPSIKSLGDSLTQTHWHFETPCGAYAHFKLTRYLLRITKDPAYGDSMERLMYNTVLGAKPLTLDGRAFYQSDYSSDGHKFYFDGYFGAVPSEWPCCSGTLPQIAADYRISTYFRDTEGVYVNLFIPSTLTWRQDGVQVSLTQTGSYPLGDLVSFELTTSKPLEFVLRLRIPAWSEQPSIRVNGKKTNAPVQPGTFLSLKREWNSKDRIELELPRKLDLKTVDSQHPDTVALAYGPLVLFALTEGTPAVTRAQLLAAARLSPESGEWFAETGGARLHFKPFWAIEDERYSTYLTTKAPDEI